MHWCLTGNPGGERAASDVLVIVFDQDVVVSWQRGQVADSAGPVFIVHTADLCFGRTLDSQVQTSWTERRAWSARLN